MPLTRGTRYPILYSGGETYAEKVRDIALSNLIAYWPLWELTGTTADNYEGTAARDGTYAGVTLGETGIGDGRTSVLCDGVNDDVDVYSTSLRDAFDPTAGTLGIWAKVNDVGVWTDSATRAAVNFATDDQNRIFIKRDGDNRLKWVYEAGNVSESRNKTGLTTTDWMFLAMTWEVPGSMQAYYNGVAEGTAITINGTWVGQLASNQVVLGAIRNDHLQPWHGWLGHAAFWDRPLTAGEVATLGSV